MGNAKRRPLKESGAHEIGQDLGSSLATPKIKPRRFFECDYVYETAQGEEWFRRRRYSLDPVINGRTKTIVYGKKSGTMWYPGKPEGADRLIYHLPDVLDARDTGDTIVWTEGEKDADAVNEFANLVATSHHGGAGKVSAEQVGWFRGHRGLVLLAYDLDKDDPKTGGNPGALDVMLRLRLLTEVAGVARSQIGIIRAKTGKDMADHFSTGHSFDEVVAVQSDEELASLRLKAKCTRGGTMRRFGYGAKR